MNSLDPDLEKRLVEMQRRIASRVVLQDHFSEAVKIQYKINF